MLEAQPSTTHLLLPGRQLQLLRYMLTGMSPLPVLETMDAQEIVQAYEFMWEKALEIGIRMRGERFSQADILKRLKSVEQYKHEVGCKEPLQRCEVHTCLPQNPACVKNKLKDQFVRLYEHIAEYLGIEFKT